jgi:outer membrane biosynthesis protein TonB
MAQHFDWLTSVITLLGIAVPSLSFLGYRRYGGQKIGQFVGSSFDRRTSYNRSAVEAESLLLSVGQVTTEQNKEMAKRIDELHKQMMKMAEESGRAKGKLEALEEQRQDAMGTAELNELDNDALLDDDFVNAKNSADENDDEISTKPVAKRSARPQTKKAAKKTTRTHNVKPVKKTVKKTAKKTTKKAVRAPSPKRGAVMVERMKQIEAMAHALDDHTDETPREVQKLERVLLAQAKRTQKTTKAGKEQ